MVMMTVVMEQMNLQSIARVKAGPALVICSLVIMAIVSLEFISVMEIMTVWTTVMKIADMNAVS